MQVWCMAHPWMTLLLATLTILALVDISGNIAEGMAGRNLIPNKKHGLKEENELEDNSSNRNKQQ